MVPRQKEAGQVSKILVVGARPGSLGAAVVQEAIDQCYEVLGAGISGEDLSLDVRADPLGEVAAKLVAAGPTHIVCTVGMNRPVDDALADPHDLYREHFETNVVGPMRLLTAWQQVLGEEKTHRRHHYVAISSNSARLPRSNSAPYCASKAALSMALRVKAREGAGSGLTVYGYEPGLLAGTPMTASTLAQFGSGVPLTRMRDPRLSKGVPLANLASLILHNLEMGPEMNGLLIPLDADEG